MKKIAILGATGYIGRSLAHRISLEKTWEVFLFSRSSNIEGIHNIIELKKYKYDVILNCTGIGNPQILRKSGVGIFKVTETMDSMLTDYLEKNPQTICIHMSSGAVYKKIDPESITPADFYSIAKINSEAKHRALSHLNIVDLRVFAFFSRFIDVGLEFFMSDVVKCIQSKKTLETGREDMVRDYVCPEDLLSLIKKIISKKKINDFFDVYSKAPASKFEILDFLKEKYGLKYKLKADFNKISPTGNKKNYCSTNKKASILGYIPKFSSISGIENEIKSMKL